MPQASPSARRKAIELQVDLLDVTPTGKSGYITVGDVQGQAKKNMAPEPAAPFLPPSEHEDFEHRDLSPQEVRDLVRGVVFPVSLLGEMRFRDDHYNQTEWQGDDLMALRPKTAAGRYRSNDGILGWFVSDRGFFADPEPTPIPTPIPAERRDNGQEPKQQSVEDVQKVLADKALDTFAVSPE